MNGNDLMNALSGLDPKYIDEAAFELHGQPAKKSSSKVIPMKRFFTIALPAAAVILLTISVALPAVKRISQSDSASYSASESASADTAPAYEAMEDAIASESPQEAEADSVPSYEDMGDVEAPAYEATADAAATEAAAESEEQAKSSESEDSSVNATASVNAAKDADTSYILGLEKAVYNDGILTVEMTGTLPANAEELDFSVTGKAADGSDMIIAEGKLGEILTGRDPLTLDLSGYDLSEGDYTLLVGDESIEFIY